MSRQDVEKDGGLTHRRQDASGPACVLASLKGSTYRPKYASAFRSAAALAEGVLVSAGSGRVGEMSTRGGWVEKKAFLNILLQ